MKYIIALSVLILFAGCGPSAEEKVRQEEGLHDNTKYVEQSKETTSPSYDAIKCQVIVIDSCEYLEYTSNSGYLYICHKGNCKYCSERRQRELQNQQDEIIKAIKENKPVTY